MFLTLSFKIKSKYPEMSRCHWKSFFVTCMENNDQPTHTLSDQTLHRQSVLLGLESNVQSQMVAFRAQLFKAS